MTVKRSHFILGAIAALNLLLVSGIQADSRAGQSLYTPCIVHPIFVQPYVSKPVISQAEIERPTFLFSLKSPFVIELPDFDRATFVQSVILPPRFDGCSEQARIRMTSEKIAAGKFEKGIFPITPYGTEPASFGAKPGVSKIFTDADACCGGAMLGK